MVTAATSNGEGESRRYLPGRARGLGVLLADQFGEHPQINPISAMHGSFCARVTRWLKDPKFAALHQDWEESLYQLAETRRQRRGQRRERP